MRRTVSRPNPKYGQAPHGHRFAGSIGRYRSPTNDGGWQQIHTKSALLYSVVDHLARDYRSFGAQAMNRGLLDYRMFTMTVFADLLSNVRPTPTSARPANDRGNGPILTTSSPW